MLQHTETSGQAHIVSWMPSGKSFRVHDRDAFSKEILPEYFRSNNFRSFQRNLSVYQFARIWSGPEKGAYCHQNFVRHDRKLCTQIKRQIAQKKEPPDNPEKYSSETRTTPSFDDDIMVKRTAEFQMNKQQPSWNATTAPNQLGGTLLTTSRGFQQAALAPFMVPNKQGHLSTSQPSYSVSTAAGVGGVFRFSSQQQSGTSQSSSMFQRGSLSLESSNSGFLAGYHNELQAAMLAEGGSSLSCREYDLSPGAVNNFLLRQQQLSLFSSNSNASAPPGGGLLDHDHGSRFMKVSGAVTDLPTSPGPQSFEDDDPFLLDRLWSQTLKMTMTAKNPLIAVRPRSMGYEQQQPQAATIWGSQDGAPCSSSNTTGATHNFSTLQQSSSSINKRYTTSFMAGGNDSASGITTTGRSFGARFHGDEDLGTRRTTDMVIHDDLVDSRGELSLLPTTSATTPSVGEYQGGVHFNHDNTRRGLLGGMSLLSTMTGSSCSGSDDVRSEEDSAAHHRRHQQLLQEEEVNSIPAPSDGSGGGDCNKQRFGGASSSSTSSNFCSEQGDDLSLRRNNDNYQVQGTINLGTRNTEDDTGPFRDIWS